MDIRVISISRQVGAAGEELAQAVAARTGFALIDKQVIDEAARVANVSPETVNEAEHAPSLMTRFLEALAKNPTLPATDWADPVPLSSTPLFTSSDYRKFVEDAIRDVAAKGNCVIVGHASQVILKDRPDTLRIFVSGSEPVRVARLRSTTGVDEKTARKTIERIDRERRDFFERFYETEWTLPCTYDLCLNTDRLTTEQGSELVAHYLSL